MNRILNFVDKATKYGFAIILALFAVACLFSGFQVENSEATEAKAVFVKPHTVTAEETSPEFLDMGEFKLTAYCACSECCGKWADGITATGTKPVQGRTIAVDNDVIPYGYEVIINGHTYTAEDCGGGIIGKEIDIYFDNHEEANEFGVRYSPVLLKVENGGESV